MKISRAAFLSALIILTLLFLISCDKSGAVTTALPSSQTTAPITTSAVTTAPTESDTVIASKDGCDYTVVLSIDAQDAIKKSADSLSTAVLKATQKRMNVRNDSSEPSDKEIIIGATTRAESAIPDGELKKNEYVIRWVGEKLVVLAGCNAALKEAVSLLYSSYFENITDSVKIPSSLNLKGEIPMDKITDLTAGWNFLKYKASNGIDIPYQIYMPSGYTADKEYACILYMHSAGVKCNDGSQIKTGEAEFLRIFEKGKYKNEAIVIAPCCPTGQSWVYNRDGATQFDFLSKKPEPYMVAATELLTYYEGELSIDKNRLYTYGMSMGAHAVWDLVSRNPGRFAAAVPAAGAGDPTVVSTMDKTAIWIFHGTIDDVVPVESSRIMKEALDKIGRTDVKYTEFPTLKHGIWSATANTDGLFDWMFSQSLDK